MEVLENNLYEIETLYILTSRYPYNKQCTKRGDFHYDYFRRKNETLKKQKSSYTKQLGLALGFSEDCADIRIAEYESGERMFTEDILRKLAKVFDIPLEILIVPVLSEPREYLVEAFWIQELGIASTCCFTFDSF